MKIKISFYGRKRGAIGSFFGESEIIETDESRREVWENVIREFREGGGGDDGSWVKALWDQPEFKPITEKWEIQAIRNISGKFMKIKTEYIPAINFWTAIDEDSYDGAFDSPTRFQIGHGLTEKEAVEDLREISA